MIPCVTERTRGSLITFEGLDGSGKSTQLARLADALTSEGYGVVTTREPGGTAIGERVRALLLDSGTSGLSPWAELALMFSARAQHIQEIILPALEKGSVVLCDRFTDSSEAYQGGGRNLGSAPVLELHRILCGDLQPNITILMDTDAGPSLSRARRRNRSQQGVADESRFEQESRQFFERVHQKYLEIAHRDANRVVRVDARREIDDVHADIL
ncbi:MAG: dTMP kinase, partial [Candidatus Korobacteraceae bacterium]